MLTSLHDSLLHHIGDTLRPLLTADQSRAIVVHDSAGRQASQLQLRVELAGPVPVVLRLTAPPGARSLWRCADFDITHLNSPSDALDAGEARRIRRRCDAALARGRDTHPMAGLLAALAQFQRYRQVPPGEFFTCSGRELLLRIQFVCNQDCSFCWQSRDWPAPPLALLKLWIDEANSGGCTRLVLSGGEPTLHPQLLDLVQHGHKLGMHVSLQTNAIRLANQPELLGALVQAGVQAVVVSYHSAGAGQSDAMTRAVGTHRRTEAGIAACLQAGLRVTLNCVVEQRNVEQLPDLADAIATRFAPLQSAKHQLSVSLSHPNLPFDPPQAAAQALSLDVAQPLVTQALRLLHKAGVLALANGPCGFPLCTLREIPELIAIAPEAARHRPGRHGAEACDNCALADRCIGPRTTYLAQFGEAGLVPFSAVPHAMGAALPQAIGEAWWQAPKL